MLLMIVAKTVLALASFQDPAPQTPGPWMWTLDRQGDAEAFEKVGLPRPDEKRAADYAALLRARLKSLVTRTEVQRNFGESFIWLDYLRIGACWSVDYPGKAEIAAEIAATRADWLEKLGKHKEAVFAAWHPFVMPEENSGNMVIACWHWNASNGSLAELVNKTDALPAMIELHKRFPSDAPATKGGDAIEEVVRNSILYGDPQTLKDFGARCVPALQKALLDGPDELPSRLNPISDPLSVLLAIDRRSAENLILSTLGQRGPTWTQRVLRALSNTGMTGGSWVNSTDPLQPPRFDDPLTLQLIDALAAQPMSSISLFALLAPLVSNDVISPAVQSFLLGHLQSTDPQIVELLHGMLDGARCGPNKRALYEAFLDSASPLLRSSCARALQHYSVGPATLRATQHSDPNVRSDALVALLRHYEFPFRYWGTPPPAERIERAVPRTPEIEAALLRLAHDGETGVRLALVNALRGAKEAPPAALLDALLSDADAGVRATACWGWDFDAALQSRALERLAGDPAPEVITAVINTLWNRSPGRNPENATEFERYLPALSKLLANAQLVVKDNHPLANLFQGALMGGGGPRAVFDVCMHGPRSAEFGPLLLDSVRWRSNNPGEVPIQRVLDAPAVAEIFALACVRLDPNPFDWLAQSVRSSIDSGELDAAPILALTRDPARPRIVRLRAMRRPISSSCAGSRPRRSTRKSRRRAPRSSWRSRMAGPRRRWRASRSVCSRTPASRTCSPCASPPTHSRRPRRNSTPRARAPPWSAGCGSIRARCGRRAASSASWTQASTHASW